MDELVILVAATDAAGHPVTQAGPDDKLYPVLQAALPSPLLERIGEVARTTFIAQAVRLDRFARRLVLHEQAPEGAPGATSAGATSAGAASARALAGPLYLFLSDEAGGYARQGFWLQQPDGERSFLPAGYINMVVGETDLECGFFESTFVHELAHLTLRTLVGDITKGPSRKQHQSMSVTDYPTAFDEGWAEHFEPLVVDASANPWLLGRQRGRIADLIATWVNQIDDHLRQEGVRRNLFVHEKPLPDSALAPGPDRFRVWLEGENLGVFLPDRLKTGQAMLSSEGVGATLFYRIVTSKPLCDRWEEPAFYDPFLSPDEAPGDPCSRFSPYENINLKLFVAMRQMAREPLDPHRPLLLDLFRTYAANFPADAGPLYQLLVETTWGATASREVVASLEALAYQGQTGNIGAFRTGLDPAIDALEHLQNELVTGQIAVDANVGPELWVLNRSFQVPASFMQSNQRTLPLTLNLNTAAESELMTVSGIGLDLARAIVRRRRERGYFRCLEELCDIPTMTDALLESLRRMQQEMAEAGLHERM